MIISNRSAWYVVKHATWPSTFFVVVHPLPAFWNEPSSDGRVYSRTRQSSPAIQSDCCVYSHIYISVHIHAREIEENIFNFFVLFLFRPFLFLFFYYASGLTKQGVPMYNCWNWFDAVQIEFSFGLKWEQEKLCGGWKRRFVIINCSRHERLFEMFQHH